MLRIFNAEREPTEAEKAIVSDAIAICCQQIQAARATFGIHVPPASEEIEKLLRGGMSITAIGRAYEVDSRSIRRQFAASKTPTPSRCTGCGTLVYRFPCLACEAQEFLREKKGQGGTP